MDTTAVPHFQVYAKRRTCRHLMAHIYLRITYQTDKVERSLDISVPFKAWEPHHSTVKKDATLSVHLHKSIEMMKNKILGAFYMLRQTSPEISLHEVVAIALEESTPQMYSVYGCFEGLIQRMEKNRGEGSSAANIQKHKVSLRHLRDYVSTNHKWNDFPFSRINRSFIDGLVDYLKNQGGCSHNTSMKHLAIFKKVYKIALDNQWIRYNAFSGYKIRIKTVSRTFQTQEEIDQIREKRLDLQRLDLVRDLFVFACFSGLSYIDTKNLARKDLQENLGLTWIRIQREKTGVGATIPLLPPAREILDKWAPDWKHSQPDKGLFKLLSNQKTNAYLKEVAELCSISKPVTFHVGRHTFATTVALTNNISLETTSKMLGHSRQSMTQHYGKILDLKIARDTASLFEKYK